MRHDRTFRAIIWCITAAVLVVNTLAQQVPTSKLRYYDPEGNEISNNEFVDIRIANPQYPDRTLVTKLEDGTTVFRLQKIPQEGSQAPAFMVKTVDGRTISSTDLKGKVVVLNFWFIGCLACIDLEPKLNAFKAKFGNTDDVVFLALTSDPASKVKEYLSKHRFDYIQGVDARETLRSFVFRGYPKNLVIDRSGKIVYWRSTVFAWDKFEAVVRAELAKN